MRNFLSKILVFLLFAAITLALGYAFLPQPLLVDLAKVERGSLRVTVDEDGKTRIQEKYVVSAPLAGRLLRIDMDPGDAVVANKTLLATIEPRDPELLDARAVAQAEANVSAAEAALRKSDTALQQAIANQTDSEADLARERSLAQRNATTQSQVEDAELLYRVRSEELRSARLAVEIAQFELEQAKAALIRSRPREDSDLANSVVGNPTADGNGSWNFAIHSPVNGRVLRVFQESAAVVSAGAPLLELGDPEELEVEIDVLSRDAVKIDRGAPVLLEHWGGPRVLNGRVRVVEPAAFTKISTLGVEEQRVNVIVDLVDPPEQRTTLGDGFRVEARIVIAEADDVLKLPTSALFRVGSEWAVFQVVDGVARQKIVEIGRQSGLEAEVTKGLKLGDVVVMHPSDQLADGVAIRQR